MSREERKGPRTQALAREVAGKCDGHHSWGWQVGYTVSQSHRSACVRRVRRARSGVHLTVDEQPKPQQGAFPKASRVTDERLSVDELEDGASLDELELPEPTWRDTLAEVWDRLPGVGRFGIMATAILLVVLACSVLAATLGEITSVDTGHHVVATSTTSMSTTPTATLSPDSALSHLVASAVGAQATAVRVDIYPSFSVIGVIISVGEQPDLTTAQETVKATIFSAQSASWQQGGYAPTTVVVTVLGPNFHSGVIATGEYGEAKLSAKTVADFDWSALTPDAAWPLYDSVALIGVSATPSPSPTSHR